MEQILKNNNKFKKMICYYQINKYYYYNNKFKILKNKVKKVYKQFQIINKVVVYNYKQNYMIQLKIMIRK